VTRRIPGADVGRGRGFRDRLQTDVENARQNGSGAVEYLASVPVRP
jgi:hypothetical protein